MIVTYFSLEEQQRYTSVKNELINELFQEVRAFEPRLHIREIEYPESKSFFRGTTPAETKYALYSINGVEAQVLIFPTEKSNFNYGYSAAQTITYLYGVINGHNITQRQLNKSHTMQKNKVYIQNPKLDMEVYHDEIYNGNEPMKVVGIRKDELELEGDYSGGTHSTIQKSWLPISGAFQWKKVCPEHEDGKSCSLSNVHCNFPDCEPCLKQSELNQYE